MLLVMIAGIVVVGIVIAVVVLVVAQGNDGPSSHPPAR